MAEHDEQKQAPALNSEELLPPEFHDPLRDTEKELGGFEEYSLSEAESGENASYLASVSALGNQMMLDIMKSRLRDGQKPRGGDPGEFAAVTDLIDVITSGFDNKVSRENFSTSYGNMLIKYSQLIKACQLYTDRRSGKKHIFMGARQTESDRLEQVSQVAQIAHREMSVIRSMSGRMANSKNGLTWRELFSSSGKLENAKLSYAKLHPDNGLALSDQIKLGTKLNHVVTKKSPDSSLETSGSNKYLAAKISRLSSKLETLELRYENMQRTLDELTRTQKSGEKLEESGSANGNEQDMEAQPQGEPVYVLEDEPERRSRKIPRMQETGVTEEH
jgi:hypothetical protein